LTAAVDLYLRHPVGATPPDQRAAVSARFDALIASRSCAGVSIEKRVEVGVPAAAILRVAGQGGHDLILIGTHGRVGLAELMIGSVAKTVIACAHCPVLTVRAEEPVSALGLS
jgi:nucleotide-binding universal stress UspA family protein